MSITPALRAQARSAYRSILRAANSTFGGDDRVLQAFRVKARSEYMDGTPAADEAAFSERVKFAREVAQVLRTNFIQAQKSAEEDVWRLRVTEHTELGSNETVKIPLPERKRRRARKGDGAACHLSESEQTEEANSGQSPSGPKPPHPHRMNYSQLKKTSQERKVPELDEKDLEETFIRGSGPGGQAINKLSNNVSLLHKPTGIRVQCQETRSLQDNRRIARKLLVKKLDQLMNPGLSKEEMKWAKERERKRRRKKKARKRAKEASKEDGENEDD